MIRYPQEIQDYAGHETVEQKISWRRRICQEYAVAYPGAEGWVDNPRDADIVWLLAAGKCGTTTLANLLNLSPGIMAMHEVAPRLWHLGHALWKTNCAPGWETLLWACKRDVVSVINGLGYVYAEMNHRLTFFAPAVERMTKGSAKYIFVMRDMDGHTYSAFRWGFYMQPGGNHAGRIKNYDITDRGEQIAWAWYEQNRWSLEFLESIPEERKFYLPFEDIKNHNVEKLESLYDFCGGTRPRDGEIEECLRLKTNANLNPIEVPKTWARFDEEGEKIMDRAREQFAGVATP